MIDASTFASKYNAFWNANAPTCEYFVRKLNLNLVERFEAPLDGASTTNRALISEFAFSLFVERMNRRHAEKSKTLDKKIVETAWTDSRRRLSVYLEQGVELQVKLNDQEQQNVSEISNRLVKFFTPRSAILRPILAGCGYIDASEADVICEKTIYEIKTVERPFRGSDIRQAITYAALNFSSGQYEIHNIGLMNPRIGKYCTLSVDNVCNEISGQPAQELFVKIIQAVSSGEISR